MFVIASECESMNSRGLTYLLCIRSSGRGMTLGLSQGPDKRSLHRKDMNLHHYYKAHRPELQWSLSNVHLMGKAPCGSSTEYFMCETDIWFEDKLNSPLNPTSILSWHHKCFFFVLKIYWFDNQKKLFYGIIAGKYEVMKESLGFASLTNKWIETLWIISIIEKWKDVCSFPLNNYMQKFVFV